MDVDTAQAQWTNKKTSTRDKTNITYYNYGKKGHLKKECRSKKEWRPVPGRETTTIDEVKKATRVREIAASYTQNDLEDDMDRADALEAALVELDTESETLAESEAEPENHPAQAHRPDNEFTDSDQEPGT